MRSYIHIRVVPKLVLILSRQTCNTIHWNSEKAHVFCTVLPFQQAPLGICPSHRTRVTAGFVKTVAHTPPKKKGKNFWCRKCVRREIFRTTLLCLQHDNSVTVWPVRMCHLIVSSVRTHFWSRSPKLSSLIHFICLIWSPRDFGLFPHLKMKLKECRLETIKEIHESPATLKSGMEM